MHCERDHRQPKWTSTTAYWSLGQRVHRLDIDWTDWSGYSSNRYIVKQTWFAPTHLSKWAQSPAISMNNNQLVNQSGMFTVKAVITTAYALHIGAKVESRNDATSINMLPGVRRQASLKSKIWKCITTFIINIDNNFKLHIHNPTEA